MADEVSMNARRSGFLTSPNIDPVGSDASRLLSRLRRSNLALDHLRYALELDEEFAAYAGPTLVRDRSI